jgi:hypothetical protein
MRLQLLLLLLLLLPATTATSGDMITEEALPTYMAMLNTLDGVRDETGASPTPWGQWTRMWVAEENRHGDLMNKYMYLTGRCVYETYVVKSIATVCIVCSARQLFLTGDEAWCARAVFN